MADDQRIATPPDPRDLPGAFREYCRAMLPLTRAMHERRQKEEVFLPVWDKTRP